MTEQTPPPGWYHDVPGAERRRWWDGITWTDRYEESAPTAPLTTSPTPSGPKEPSSWSRISKSRWFLPTAVGVVALFVGVGIGTSSPAEEEPDTKSTSGLTVADLDDRESELDARESALEVKGIDLDNREAEVEKTEEAVNANTIDGDGTYEVGSDINAGRYKNADADDLCYWSVNNDPNGNDIVANHNGGGPLTVEVKKGQYLELSGCGTWKKVG